MMRKQVKFKALLSILSLSLATPFLTTHLSSCNNHNPQPTFDWHIDFNKGWRLNYVYGGKPKKQFASFAFVLRNFVGGEILEFSLDNNDDDKPEICFDNGSTKIRIQVKDNLDQISVPIGLKDESLLTTMDALNFNLKVDLYWKGDKQQQFTLNDMWLIVGKPTTEDMFDIVEEGGDRTLIGFKEDEQTKNELNDCSILVIPISVNKIASNAFYRSYKSTIPYSIKYLVLDEYFGTQRSKLEVIGSSAFEHADIETLLFFPDSIKEIQMYAFSESTFSGELNLPESLIRIGDKAFYKCSNLTGDLIIPPLVNFIGNMAFSQCTGFDKSLTFLRETPKIGFAAFEGCSKIKEINLEPFTSLPIWLTDYENSDIFKNLSASGKVNVPSFLDVWQDKLYSSCGLSSNWLCVLSINTVIPYEMLNISENGEELYGLKEGVDISWYNKLILPIGVKKIVKEAFKNVLVTPNVPLIQVDLYNGTLVEIEDDAFNGCTNIIGEIRLPSTFNKIGKQSFLNCININSLVLPRSLSDIGEKAFAHCGKIKKIYMETYSVFPPWLTNTTENNIFEGINPYGSVYVRKNFNCEECWKNLCDNCGLSHRWNVYYKGKVVPLSCFDLSFDGKTINGLIDPTTFKSCDTIILPDGIEAIGEKAFSNKDVYYSNIQNIELNTSLKSIGPKAFQTCTNFKGHLSFPDSLETIGELAFENSNFSFVSFSNKITSVGENAFHKCQNIKEVDISTYLSQKPEWFNQPKPIFNFSRKANGGTFWISDTLERNQVEEWRHILTYSLGLLSTWIVTSKSRVVDPKYFILEDGGKSLSGVNWDGFDAETKDTIKLTKDITKINKHAFGDVVFPSCIRNFDFNNGSLIEICTEAFETSDINFASIYLPPNIQRIGESAFNAVTVSRELCVSYVWYIEWRAFGNVWFNDEFLPAGTTPTFYFDISDLNANYLPEWYTRKDSLIFDFFEPQVADNYIVLYEGTEAELKKLKEDIKNRTHLDLKVWDDWRFYSDDT